jgi:hypothetical protein
MHINPPPPPFQYNILKAQRSLNTDSTVDRKKSSFKNLRIYKIIVRKYIEKKKVNPHQTIKTKTNMFGCAKTSFLHVYKQSQFCLKIKKGKSEIDRIRAWSFDVNA